MKVSEKHLQAARRKARRGARFLDKKLGPGWRLSINVSRLNMGYGSYVPRRENGCGCVLAQLDAADSDDGVGLYMRGAENLGLNADGDKARRLGFVTAQNSKYAALDVAWKEEVLL